MKKAFLGGKDVNRRWPLGIAIILLLALALIPKLLIVPALTEQFRAELQREFQTKQVQVELHTPLGWELFFGRLPRVDVLVKDALVDNLILHEVQVVGTKIRFSPRMALENWENAYLGADKLEGFVTITEQDLNKLLWDEVDPEQLLNFTVSPQGLALEGDIPFFGQELGFTLYGILEPVTGSHIRFIPQDFEVQATRIPKLLLEVLNQNYDLVLDFSIFPYPVSVSQILLEDAQLRIKFGVVL